MDKIFTSTHWRDTTRNLLVNNERILYIERTSGERVVYTVTFDNGHTLELDEPTGKAFARELGQLQRPSQPVKYIDSGPHRYPRNLPRRRAIG